MSAELYRVLVDEQAWRRWIRGGLGPLGRCGGGGVEGEGRMEEEEKEEEEEEEREGGCLLQSSKIAGRLDNDVRSQGETLFVNDNAAPG